MLDSYRRIFNHSGAAAFSATGLLARLPISMMTLGIVLLISARSGSYGAAGAVSAAYVIGNAAVAVPHGRLADRFGQTPVLYVDAVGFALATGLLIESGVHGWPTPLPHVFGALAGVFLPQIGSLVRARWAALLSDAAQKQTAFSVEAVVDEVVFVTGPALVTFLSTLVAPEAGLVVALVTGSAGTVLLAAQRRTQPPLHHSGGVRVSEPLPWGRLLPLCASATALGTLFGAIEVATVAFAGDAGHKPVSGLMLAAFSFGSLVAGVVSGALTWRAGLRRRYVVGVGVLAITLCVLPWLSTLWVAGAVLLLIGLTLAPTLIAMFSLLEEEMPRSRLTEGMAFLQTGISAGIAPGAWLAGIVADDAGGAAAYWVCAGGGAVAFVSGLLIRTTPRIASAHA